MKILLLDIETAPNLVHVWGLWNQNVSLNQIMASGYVLCWAAKWRGDGDDQIMFDSIHRSGPKRMLNRIHNLLDKCDACVTYNGRSFDLPTLNKEFVQRGFKPPSPYKSIDLYITAKKIFRFPSNKLEYIARALGLGGKVKHEGHELWVKTMAGDKDAWARMEEYNRGDVILLDGLYTELMPWIPSHPNVALYDHAGFSCPTCGGVNLQFRGYAYTSVNEYRRLRCSDCGRWSREAMAHTGKEEREKLYRSVV